MEVPLPLLFPSDFCRHFVALSAVVRPFPLFLLACDSQRQLKEGTGAGTEQDRDSMARKFYAHVVNFMWLP